MGVEMGPGKSDGELLTCGNVRHGRVLSGEVCECWLPRLAPQGLTSVRTHGVTSIIGYIFPVRMLPARRVSRKACSTGFVVRARAVA
jgi:hypothetical protein